VRTLVLIDGEHHPPVVADAVASLPERIPGSRVVGAAFLGGTEKLRTGPPELGVPIVGGDSAEGALVDALARFSPDLVVDLCDEPVVDERIRLRLASRALAAGAVYQAADARFDPPPRPRLAAKPSVAIIGTAKRAGKTAVTAQLARALRGRGTPPVVVAMGRGGPPVPEVLDPGVDDVSIDGLVALAAAGRHAASDHIEDAVMAGVTTIGARRCGGGPVGAPFVSNVAEAVALANGRPEPLLLLEGSGRAIPPVHADATICVVPASADPAVVADGLGSYRLLLTDLVVITMAGSPHARSGAVGTGSSARGSDASEALAVLERSIRGLVPGARIIHTVFRPTPLVDLEGRHVIYVTTAPPAADQQLVDHLERVHGCTVVGTSHHLADRPRLRSDLEKMGDADVVLVELKAAAVDVVAGFAASRGIDIEFCDNRVVAVGGDHGQIDRVLVELADLAITRHDPSAS
jgi:cyclic 2,3-diphosphoglycerate synthetase